MTHDEEIEKMMQERNLTAPSVKPVGVDRKIVAVDYHVFPTTCLTVCVITLENGFNVTGESACASPENFNRDIGEKIAFRNAREKIWPLEGYLLKQRLFEDKIMNGEV